MCLLLMCRHQLADLFVIDPPQCVTKTWFNSPSHNFQTRRWESEYIMPKLLNGTAPTHTSNQTNGTFTHSPQEVCQSAHVSAGAVDSKATCLELLYVEA